MENVIHVTINGRKCACRPGETVLDVCRREKIYVPALCEHKGLEDYGACRMCVVEIRKKGWSADWSKIVASCLYPVEEGLEVMTATEKVLKARKTVLALLLARCPEADVLKDMAAHMGVDTELLVKGDPADKCILCGLCVRACEAVGTGAISLVDRGINKRVATPFDRPPEDCVGCLSCARACPTGCIEFSEEGGVRRIWDREFELLPCKECGALHVTRAQAEYWTRKYGLEPEYFELCDACKRKHTGETFLALSSFLPPAGCDEAGGATADGAAEKDEGVRA